MLPPCIKVGKNCVSVTMVSKPGSLVQSLPYSDFFNCCDWHHVNLAIPQ